MGLEAHDAACAARLCSVAANNKSLKCERAMNASAFRHGLITLANRQQLNGAALACPLGLICMAAQKARISSAADGAAQWQVGELTRREVAELRRPRVGDGVERVEDVVAFLQPYSDRIILDAKTHDVVRRIRVKVRGSG